MSTHGTNETGPRQPPRLTAEEAERIWRAKWAADWHDTGLALLALFMAFELGLAAVQGAFQQRLLVVCGQIGVLLGLRWAGRAGLRWAGRAWHSWLRAYARRQRQRRAQRGTTEPWRRALLLVMLLGSILQGCAGAYDGLARLVGCDPVAIEQGYCTMPQGGGKP